MGFIDNPPYVSRESLPTRIAAMRWWFWLQKVMQGFDRMLSFVPARGGDQRDLPAQPERV